MAKRHYHSDPINRNQDLPWSNGGRRDLVTRVEGERMTAETKRRPSRATSRVYKKIDKPSIGAPFRQALMTARYLCISMIVAGRKA